MSGNSLDDFPKLSETDLYGIALGTYQLKQAKSYYTEHLNENKGRFEIQVCKHIGPLPLHSYSIACDDPMLIRGRIHSRFRNQTKYLLYTVSTETNFTYSNIYNFLLDQPILMRFFLNE
jgi:hypothetical protein